MERKIHPTTYTYVNGYKACRTSGHEGGVVVFIKKRLFGFLWWVYVKDIFGNPVTYNHYSKAEAFMQGKFGYYDHIHTKVSLDENNKIVRYHRRMTEEDAWEEICNQVEDKSGTRPEVECAKRAWEFEGKKYIHSAVKYALLWHSIYEKGGKKLWIKEQA